MRGCDRCGAQALATEATCPVCGMVLAAARPAASAGAPHIPVRRHGTVPRQSTATLPLPAERATLSLMALVLGALGAMLIAAGLGYWLW